jgi:hypothetical protein
MTGIDCFANRTIRLEAGTDMKFNDYQWIDIIRPWVGAPLILVGLFVATARRAGASAYAEGDGSEGDGGRP